MASATLRRTTNERALTAGNTPTEAGEREVEAVDSDIPTASHSSMPSPASNTNGSEFQRSKYRSFAGSIVRLFT